MHHERLLTNSSPLWLELERLLRHDPQHRGIPSLIEADSASEILQLRQVAIAFHETARIVAIVTGFSIIQDGHVAGETDGPPGALYLARALLELGIEVVLISDGVSLPLLQSGCDHWGLPRNILREFPFESADPDANSRRSNEAPHLRVSDAWVQAFLSDNLGSRLTHLVAIERVGPSHTPESLVRQPHTDEAPVALFLKEVAPEHYDVCHNMRGIPVDVYTAKTHRLFELVAERRPEVVTVGMADGGNEIGMGRFPWEVIRRTIAASHGGAIACRIATDHLMLSGVSNWSAYAVALSLCQLRGKGHLATRWDIQDQNDLIETLVRDAGAVDGVTGHRTASVDGLSLDVYLQTLGDLRCLLGHQP